MALLESAIVAKLAPVLFLTVSKEGFKPNVYQIAHTLVVSAIVALVTMYGTVRVVEAKLEHIEKSVDKLVVRMDSVATRQAGVIAQADEIHKSLQDRMAIIERRR